VATVANTKFQVREVKSSFLYYSMIDWRMQFSLAVGRQYCKRRKIWNF